MIGVCVLLQTIAWPMFCINVYISCMIMIQIHSTLLWRPLPHPHMNIIIQVKSHTPDLNEWGIGIRKWSWMVYLKFKAFVCYVYGGWFVHCWESWLTGRRSDTDLDRRREWFSLVQSHWRPSTHREDCNHNEKNNSVKTWLDYWQLLFLITFSLSLPPCSSPSFPPLPLSSSPLSLSLPFSHKLIPLPPPLSLFLSHTHSCSYSDIHTRQSRYMILLTVEGTIL